MRRISIACLLALFARSPAWAQQDVGVPREDGAQTPLRVFQPAGGGCAPLAILSPGAGGSENGLQYLAEALRDAGWLAVVVGHRESGPAVLRSHMHDAGLHDGLLALTTDADAYRARFMDIGAALRWAGQGCKPPFAALIGHSMGAATAMLEAGARNKLGLAGLDRFAAYVALSPQGPGSIFPEHAWHNIRKPVLLLTGTRDKALEGSWETRATPFGDLPAGCAWLGVIDGATHMNLAGSGFARRTRELTVRTSLSFLDALRAGACGSPAAAAGIAFQAK